MSWYIALDVGQFDLYFPEPFMTKYEAKRVWKRVKGSVDKSLHKRVSLRTTIREGSYEFVTSQICTGFSVVHSS